MTEFGAGHAAGAVSRSGLDRVISGDKRTPWVVRRFHDAHAYAQHVAPWLLEAEAEHNLLLGILAQLESGDHSYERPLYLATAENQRGIQGCAFRTPPFPLGLTQVPEAAIPPLVADIAELYDSLPGVLAPEPTAGRFARQWAERCGVYARPDMQQRIYRLDHVRPPRAPVNGSVRRAREDDLRLARKWAEAFAIDTGVPMGDSNDLVDRAVRTSSMFLWISGDAIVSMAAAMGETPNGVRIGYVYTPPSHRRHGYASALVTEVSQHFLSSGRRFCFLYTDMANSTTNAIYQRIGYQPVCEVALYGFAAGEERV